MRNYLAYLHREIQLSTHLLIGIFKSQKNELAWFAAGVFLIFFGFTSVMIWFLT